MRLVFKGKVVVLGLVTARQRARSKDVFERRIDEALAGETAADVLADLGGGPAGLAGQPPVHRGLAYTRSPVTSIDPFPVGRDWTVAASCTPTSWGSAEGWIR
jgi:hypothetical protein